MNKNIAIILILMAVGFITKSFWIALLIYGLIVLIQAIIDKKNNDL